MKSLGNLLSSSMIALAGASGCQTTPGMEEPKVWSCVMVDETRSRCFYSHDESQEREMQSIDMIGFQCFSPGDVANISTHHNVLHKELNKAKKRR